MWTDADVDALLDEWENDRPTPADLLVRLPEPPHEFFDRVLERHAERYEERKSGQGR